MQSFHGLSLLVDWFGQRGMFQLLWLGLYVEGPSVAFSVLGIYFCIVPFSYITAYLRLITGSVWPSVIIHTTWNAIIQGPFARASTRISN